MRLVFSALVPVVFAYAGVFGQTSAAWHGAPPQELIWAPAPGVLPHGAQMAVMAGDPASPGVFTVRLRLPDGYRIPPHMHPTDMNITVIRGTLRIGMGSRFQGDNMLALGSGGFATAPANHAHYFATRGVTIVQIQAIGPFAMTYINPADAPRQTSLR
jgi:hypothetical protein